MRKNKHNPGIEDDPVGGIWYYVFLRPRWELIILHGEQHLHTDMWKRHIVPLLRKKYKFSRDEVSLANDLPYSMPRGRVTEVIEGGESVFIVRHGKDFPVGLRQESELKKIVAEFGLTNRSILGQVEFIYDPHETTVEEERVDMKNLIGDFTSCSTC